MSLSDQGETKTHEGPSHKSESSSDNLLSRRPFIKAAGSLGTVGIAGCAGNQTGAKTETKTETGTKVGTPQQTPGGEDFSNTEFTWMDNNFYITGTFAVKAIKRAAKNWEEKTGGTIHLNTATTKDVFTALRNRNQPHLVTSNSQFIAPAAHRGQIRPYSTYKDQIRGLGDNDPSTGYIPGIKGRLKRMWSGFDNIYGIPVAAEPRMGFLGNMKHFEKTPGLDKEKDFPPKNIEHLIQVARKLDEDGPAQIGYQMIGSKGDMLEALWQWLFAGDVVYNGRGGMMFDLEDWSKTIVNNKTWKQVLTKYFKIWKKHKIGAPNTLQINHEASVPMMLTGQVSLTPQPYDAHAAFVNRGGLAKFTPKGPLKWAPGFGLKTGITQATNLAVGAIMKPQPDANKSKWRRSQKAAIDFLNHFMTSDAMTNTMVSQASMQPTLQQPFNNMVRSPRTLAGNWLPTVIKAMEGSTKMMYHPAHPEFQVSKVKKVPKHLHKSLKGKMSTAKALENAHDELQAYLDNQQYMWD